nr:hypothetical protein [Novosphingobium sp. KN65.2]
MKHPITAEHSRPHPVFGLFAVLLALVLRHAGQQVFDQNAVGILTKLNGRGFQRRARPEDGFLEIEVIANVPRHAAYVVDDDDKAQLAALADERQHIVKAGALRQLAGNVIGEHGDDFMPAMLRIFAATGFLRGQAVAFRRLFLGADAAVDDCLLIFFPGHGRGLFFEVPGITAPPFPGAAVPRSCDEPTIPWDRPAAKA